MLASDLHVHLDGSLRETTIAELARSQGAWPDGFADPTYASRLRFRDGMTLPECLGRFEATVGLLQSAETLSRVACELVEDSHLDGAHHIEVRVCPTLHTRAGLSPDGVVESVLSGLERGAARAAQASPGDRASARVVVTILEGMTDDAAASLVALAARHAGGVSGIDLAGNEALFDAGRYRRAFSMARDAGLGLVVHAGEGHAPDHIRSAVTELGAQRIGHGTSAARDPAVMSLLAERAVTVEVCLSSNVHTGAVESIGRHPLRTLLANGVRAALATDNRFFSSTTLSREYDLAREHLGIGDGDAAALVMESARAAFLPDDERRSLAALYAESLGRGYEAAGGAARPGGTDFPREGDS
jgi:adenosine deaminase